MLQNKMMKFRNLKTKMAAGTALAMASVGSAFAGIAEIQAAIITKIGEAEAFAYALLTVSLVAIVGITLVKKFAKKGAS